VIVSAHFLRRLLGHLDGPRIANSYIRMGYAALGSAVAGAGALWLMGSYSADGFAWSGRIEALVTIVIVGPVMLVVYLFLLKLFRVTELRDLLQPLLGRLGRRAGATAAQAGSATGTPAGTVRETAAPERATVSVDTGLIPRISGEFDAASFRAGPQVEGPADDHSAPQPASPDGYLPAEEVPNTARGSFAREEIPLPGRRTYQGTAGRNPYFSRRPESRRKKKR
jgi:putative peptidoglycan lipid II flippase